MTTTNRISNPPQSALLLLLILIAAPALGSTTTCSGSKDVMVVDAFVDIYPAAEPVILATSDGGAAMATLLTSNGNSRILKVNAAAKLQWFVESRVDGGEDFYWYVPKALAESTDETAGVSYLYVAGYTPYTKAFVVKYNMATGTYVSSGFAQKDTSFSQINGLFLDSSGSLVFAGFYGDESSPAVWMGTIDKSTLVGTTQLVVSSYSTLGKVHKVVLGSDGSYVVAGTVDTGGYLWLAAVSGSTWTINWEIECTSASGVASALMEVNSGTYGLLLQGTYYVATSTGIVSSVSVGQISGMQLAPSDSTKLLFAGSTTQSFESVAYIYDPAADCRYDSGETARHDRVRFRGLSRTSSSVSYVWASGYVQDRYATFASLVKLQEVSPLACNSSSTNYLNKACYPSLNSTMCFGLCSACLISDDLNACVAGTFGAHRYAISLFAGRCARPGYHYRASTLSCSPVIQSGCHPLCGGECFLAADATQCAHHCKGISLEPYIDDSELGTNICRCRLGAVYNSDTKKCELVTGCSSMCGTGGCGKSANSAKCANCISSATVTATDSEGYVTCACATNSVLVDGVCKACHAYCNGCTAPADNTKCTACAAIQSIQRRGVSSPYFCSCASDATYDSTTGMCVYTSGCSSHCDKCVTQNNATACIGCASGITSVILNVDGVTSSCACPAAKVFYNGSCVEVLTSSSGVSCHPFCSGACFAPNDATKCAVSCAKSEYYTVTSSVDDQVTCGCASGARLNSAGECVADYQCDAICDTCANSQTCLACPASDGMLLRDGSCICDITEGYALAYDREGEQAGGSSATCIKKVSMVTSSLQYSGFVSP